MTDASETEKAVATIFVIMPFVTSLDRNQEQLTSFFEHQIKKPIQEANLRRKYVVSRSDDSLNITDQIIKDLYMADIVICDLSGEQANPNVMYELGMRFAFSNGPVILIRQQHVKNRDIFDISGFYTQQYDPQLHEIGDYLVDKIRRFEDSDQHVPSPVLAVLGQEVPLLQRISGRRAAYLLAHLEVQLERTLMMLAALVRALAKSSMSIEIEGDQDAFAKFLSEEPEALSSVPLKEFEFRLGNQPTIDAYIAAPYLDGLLDNEVVTKFTDTIFAYYARFIATDILWHPLSLATVTSFTTNNLILQKMANSLQQALLDPSAKATAIERFETHYAELVSTFKQV